MKKRIITIALVLVLAVGTTIGIKTMGGPDIEPWGANTINSEYLG